MECISVKNLSISYEGREVVKGLTMEIQKGKITTIIGGNGCGKSTILKSVTRILKPDKGEVRIKGKLMEEYKGKELAQIMGILPQGPVAPEGLLVEELVAYGRFPHQKGFASLTQKDREMVNWALESTKLTELKGRRIEELSGGQRQRAWIAMTLAQDTEILILDEPTTYLDLVHQLEVLTLLQKMNQEKGTTIVMVIHDLNIAARFADYMIGIKEGEICCQGKVEEVMSPENLKKLFHIDAEIVQDPRTKKPVCLTFDTIKDKE